MQVRYWGRSCAGGQAFGNRVDNAIRIQKSATSCARADPLITVFLEDSQTYDGGEPTVETTFGVHQVKLPVGHAVLYPSSSLHRVEPSPAEMAQQINRAAEAVRVEDRHMLDTARAALDRSAGQIDRVVKRGQGADRQIERQILARCRAVRDLAWTAT
ncbi:putative hydroxylase [Sphingobium sp. MI1205]|nr:putative hydroxylase [Sphingobium sp. MI1205]